MFFLIPDPFACTRKHLWKIKNWKEWKVGIIKILWFSRKKVSLRINMRVVARLISIISFGASQVYVIGRPGTPTLRQMDRCFGILDLCLGGVLALCCLLRE